MPAFAAMITFILIGMTGNGKSPLRTGLQRIRIRQRRGPWSFPWIPGLAIVMEPVRALLVGIGLVKMIGVSLPNSRRVCSLS